MFVKIYQYYVQPDKVEEFLSLQEKVSEIYSKSLNFHTMYINSKEDETKWIEITRYKDEIEYVKSMTFINEKKEIQELFARFQSMLLTDKNGISEEDFIEKKDICNL
ncbi:hypothetical protein KD050_20750 [Psychrobacillus sp. INOP01]|uniref:hypothetical protein n=1 Tax=Psychrobacillus sp. INOP01 TaxID=2829187 RepID=UPI001BAC16D4|nr:hypothetical protein [Psychrobacillus sp. INOP01]QUG41659.1 hypothetical protein KD050_20750 [Psychrobacillus sp. INOP01]